MTAPSECKYVTPTDMKLVVVKDGASTKAGTTGNGFNNVHWAPEVAAQRHRGLYCLLRSAVNAWRCAAF
jgi:hypothetical protein